MRLRDLETLRPLHKLLQPAGCNVRSLVCDGREVGEQVVVWGRRGGQYGPVLRRRYGI